MPQTTTPIDSLETTLDRLARLDDSPVPIVSLYLNLRADAQGKDNYQSFVRKELPARARTFAAGSPERDSVDRDITRIQAYLEGEVPASANGLALFASSGRDGLFEALVLDLPFDQHRLSISPIPQLAPLALLRDQHPRHALVLADSHAARIFVFDGGAVSTSQQVAGEKIRRSSGGGWSQARYQRRHDNLQAEHARELVETLERLVRDERIEHVVLAGDEVNVPLVKRELSKELEAKVIDVVRLEPRAPVQQVMEAAAEAMRRHDARTDAEVVAGVLDAYRSGGLGVAGIEATRDALVAGQVDELYLTVAADAGADAEGQPRSETEELIALAARTAATTRFIEDPALLADVGGVAAALRFRMKPASTDATSNPTVKGATNP
jgi:peptide subunit release factor 1 (eRF1)